MKNLKLLLTFVVATCLLYSLGLTISFARAEETSESVTETESSSEETIDLEELEAIDTGNVQRFSPNTPIVYTADTYNIEVTSYEFRGVSVTQNENVYSILPIETYGSFIFDTLYRNGERNIDYVCIYKTDDWVYVSDVSIDHAIYGATLYDTDHETISQEQWEEIFWDYSCSLVTVENEESTSTYSTRSISTGDTVLRGTIEWEVEPGTTLPLRNTKIELRNKNLIGSSKIATTYTDQFGNYSFSFENNTSWIENGYDVFIKIIAESKTVHVAPQWFFAFCYFSSDIIYNIETGSETELNYLILSNQASNVYRCFYVEQGMVVGERFIEDMDVETQSYINVRYPAMSRLDVDDAFCWGGEGIGYYSQIGIDLYNDYDTLIHEYGHFVSHILGVYGPSLLDFIFYNANHTYEENKFARNGSKDYPMELNWSESWATAFSQIAQYKYSGQYNDINDFADNMDNRNNRDFSTLTQNYYWGEDNEFAVVCFLWKYFKQLEKPNSESHYKEWFEMTTRAGIYTLQDFVNSIETNYPDMINIVGELMGKNQIAPSQLEITNQNNVSATVAPQLSWTVNGSESYPNNKFDIAFYGTDNKLIHTTQMFSKSQAYNSTATYTVSQEDWEKVLEGYAGEFSINIVVRGYNSRQRFFYGNELSGPYFSRYASIKLTISNPPLNVTMEISEFLKLEKDKVCEYSITFSNSRDYLIETVDDLSFEISVYNANGSQLATGIDCLTYNFLADTTYKLRISNEGDEIVGNTTIVIRGIYSLTYKDVGGGAFTGNTENIDMPTCHYYGLETQLITPTKANYIFLGWFLSSDGNGAAITSLASDGVTSDLIIYAKWVGASFDIIYRDIGDLDFSGIMPTGYPTTHAYDGETELPIPTKDGYSFEGWYLDKYCSITEVDSLEMYEYTSDITLYALWSQNQSSGEGDTIIFDLDASDLSPDQNLHTQGEVTIMAEYVTIGAGQVRVRITQNHNLTVSCDEGHYITQIVLSLHNYTGGSLTSDVGTIVYEEGQFVWIGQASSVTFYATSNKTIIVTDIEVTII